MLRLSEGSVAHPVPIRMASSGVGEEAVHSASRGMPHFYFHLRTPASWERDDMGLDFVGLEAAYLDAYRTIPEMAADLVRRKRDPLRYAFEITDEAGQLLIEVPFSEMLDKWHKPRRPVMPALAQKAQAEMERTVHLIAALVDERKALETSLREMQELVARAREISARSPWHRRV